MIMKYYELENFMQWERFLNLVHAQSMQDIPSTEIFAVKLLYCTADLKTFDATSVSFLAGRPQKKSTFGTISAFLKKAK